MADMVLSDCAQAHIAVNHGKSQLDPVQRLQHLGFLVDLQAGTFEVPLHRWEALQTGIAALLAAPRSPIRSLTRGRPARVDGPSPWPCDSFVPSGDVC